MFGVRMKSFCCSAGSYSLGPITKFLFFYFLIPKVNGTGEKQRLIACSRQGPRVLTLDRCFCISGVVRKFGSQKNVSLPCRPVGTVSRGYSLSRGKEKLTITEA